MSTPTSEVKDLVDFLKNSCTSPSKLDCVLNVTQKNEQKKLIQNFCLIKCDRNSIREDDFIEFLFLKLIDYALEYSVTHPKELTKEQLIQWLLENSPRLVSLAKRSFLLKNDTGELGELFLFIALEDQGFIRLINKMSFKTTKEIPFHGWDAVHIGFDEDENLLFCLGSSKMHKRFSGALSETFKEIEKYTNNKEKFNTEIRLISSYIDSERFDKFGESIPKFLSPYYPDKSNIGQAHPVFLGYEWDFLDDPKSPSGMSLDTFICAEYEKKHARMMRSIKKQVKKLTTASNNDFIVWVLPFKNVQEIRNKFLAKLKEP